MEWVKSKHYLQYPSTTPKYTTSDPYWMQNNLFFDITFLVHYNLKMIIKIFSTIYLSLAVIFPYVPLNCYHDSWDHKPQKIVHDTAKKGSTTNHRFSMTIRPLKMICNFIKFYSPGLKWLYLLISPVNGNLIHEDIICAAPKFGFLAHDISTNNAFS